MSEKSSPDGMQKTTKKGARGTIVHIDSGRDNSSLTLGNVAGNDLGKGDLSHSISGCSVASEK